MRYIAPYLKHTASVWIFSKLALSSENILKIFTLKTAYPISSVKRQRAFFLFPNNPKNLALSYTTDLDVLGIVLEEKKTTYYSGIIYSELIYILWLFWMFQLLFCCFTSNVNSMSGLSVNLTKLFLGRIGPSQVVSQYFVHILKLSPVTDNCPSWISGRRNESM